MKCTTTLCYKILTYLIMTDKLTAIEAGVIVVFLTWGENEILSFNQQGGG
jgi:hypothetical protein